MAKYIRKHRRQFMGVVLPVFFLFLFGAISLSVFPGWLRPSYATPGAACTGLTDPTCDPCNGEICTLNSNSSQCGVLSFVDTFTFATTVTFDPAATAEACPNGALVHALTLTSLQDPVYPGCFDQCTPTIISFNDTQVLAPVCSPSSTFCDGIAGGDGPNACRTGACQASATPDPANPSGCDYQLVPSAQNDECVVCEDPTPPGFTTCGNGICEPGEGEDCASCGEDCTVPGFEGVCPAAKSDLDNACFVPAGIEFVTFDGPPYNVPLSNACEDGDVCTTNTCNGDVCGPATDKLPSGDFADFCCPDGAVAPTSPGACPDLLGSNCDVDCYVPIDCVPTPSPTAIPNNLDLFGDGFMPCSLHPGASTSPMRGLVACLSIGVALSALIVMRRRAS